MTIRTNLTCEEREDYRKALLAVYSFAMRSDSEQSSELVAAAAAEIGLVEEEQAEDGINYSPGTTQYGYTADRQNIGPVFSSWPGGKGL